MSVVTTQEQAKTARDRQRAERLRELRDLRDVMSTEEGRRVMWRLLSECRVFLSTYSPKELESYYRQGRRAVGLIFFNDMMEGCRELFWKAQDENLPKERNHG
ncbi:MAG: hypothetical protein AB7D47_13160 [Desulfovibrio sp.]